MRYITNILFFALLASLVSCDSDSSDDSQSNSTMEVSGTCFAGETVDISGEGIKSQSLTCPESGAFNLTVGIDPDVGAGDVIISSGGVILSEDMGTRSGASSIFFDFINVPGAPEIISPANASIHNSPLEIEVVCADGQEMIVSNTAYLLEPFVHSCSSDAAETLAVPITSGLRVSGTTFSVQGSNSYGKGPKVDLVVDLDTDNPVLKIDQLIAPLAGTINRTPVTMSFRCSDAGETLQIGSEDLLPNVQEHTCSGHGVEHFPVSIAEQVFTRSSQLKLRVVDEAGNASAALTVETGLDSVTPSTPSVASPYSGSSHGSTVEASVECFNAVDKIVVESAGLASNPSIFSCTEPGFHSVSLQVKENTQSASEDLVFKLQAPSGQFSDSVTVNVSLDSAAPAAPVISSPSAGSSHGSSIPVSFQCTEAGSTVTLSNVHTNERKTVCVGTEQQTITLFTSGATSISSTPILLSAKDSFGNTSPTSIVSVAIDTIAESPPTLLAPESGEQITGPLVVRFQCASANQTIVTENPYILPNGKRVHQCTEVGETTISIDIWDQTSVLSSPLKLHSIDQNGNKSDQTTISIGLKGSAHPTPEILSPAAGSVHSDSIPFVVSCLAAGTSLNFSGSGIVSHTHVCSSAANYSVDLDLQPGTEDQASQVSMTSYDSFGFSSTKIVSLHLDNSAPALPEVLDNSQWINSTSSTPMVSWSSSSSDDISRYELAVGSSPGASDLVDWADVGLVLSSTLSTPQLDECSTYYASLRTVDNFGNTSEALASATGFVPDVSPPLQPSSLQLGLDSTPALSDTLVWQASADNCQLSHYDFAIGSTPASNDKLDWVSVEQALTHQAAGVFIGPQVNHSSVRAVDAAGNLSTVSSSEAWVVRPEAITTLAYAARTATSIEVAWTEPESYQYELVDYIIEYKKTNETDWSVLNDGVNTEINAMVTGLEPSTTYDLRVSASNGRDSEPSASIAEFTAPNSSFFDPESYQAFNLGGATDSTVVVYEDGTEVKLNGSTIANLNAGESFRFTSALNDEVEANNPFFLAGKSQAGTAVNYIANMVWNIPAWSGKSFSFTGTRDANHLVNIRAFEAATVNLYRDNSGTPFQSQVMAANTNHLFSVPNGSYKVESTGLITGYLYSSGGDGNRRVDSMPILPAATDLLGYPSRWGHLSSLVESNEFSLIESSSNSGTTGTLNPFSTYTVTAKGNPTSLYRSDAMRILSQDKMVARSNADADGWSSAPFMPRAFMRKKYALNVNADYVAFVSDKPAVIEFINPADGSVAHTITLSKTGTHPMAPYKGYTNTYDLQGYIYQSADKFGAWYQPNSNNGGGDQDETIMFGTDD